MQKRKQTGFDMPLITLQLVLEVTEKIANFVPDSNIQNITDSIVAANGLVASQPTSKSIAFYEGIKRQVSLK